MSQTKAPVILNINATPTHLKKVPANQSKPALPPPERSGIQTMVEDMAKRVEHRSRLVATLAGLNGVEVSVQDLAEQMWAKDPGNVSLAALGGALETAGIKARFHNRASLVAARWPAIAEMKNGQAVLVVGQDKDVLFVFDESCPDNRAEVPVAEFEAFFSGALLSAKSTLQQIADRHVPNLTNAHWFWGEFPRYRRHATEVMLGSFVANVLAVAVALFSLQVYDRVIPHQSQATLWVLAIGAMLAICLEGILKLARAQLSDAAGRQIELSVQDTLMKRLVGMRSDQKPLPASGLFAAMRDFSTVREFFTSYTLSVIADFPFIIIFLALIASIAGNVVWVLILGGILMILPAYFLQKRLITLSRQSQGVSAKAGRVLQEVVSELDTLKFQRGEERVMRLWQELNTLSSQTATEQRRLSGALTYWSQGVQQMTYIATVVIGTYLVFAGQFTVGTIIATGILTSRTLAPLTQFATVLARWSQVKAALEGLETIVNAPQEREAKRKYLRRDTLKGEIEMREVSFAYEDGSAPSLDVPKVSIKAGEHITVLGANGSGKSTLLKVIAGLYTPDKGRVLLDRTDMAQIEPKDLRRGIGYLGQEVRLFSGSLRDNLNLTQLERDDDRLMQALDFAGLGPFLRQHSQGLDLEIKDGGEGLSVGQRQSIGWARLWLQNPKVVLLDEPTAALDQTLERTLVSRLATWLEGRTAIIATHRTPIVALSNRALILQSGRLVVDGPREQVFAHLASGESG